MAFSDRLMRQQRHGSAALVGAIGLLAGVMLTTISNGDDTVSVGSTSDSVAESSFGVADANGGFSTAGDAEAAAAPGTEPGTAPDGSVAPGAAVGTDPGAPTPGAPAPASAAAGGTGPSPAGGGSAAAPAPTATGNSGASARGVTGTAVKVGVAYLDLAALGQFPQFRIVPGDKAMKAIYDGWKKSGEVPVHGRDVQLALVPYNVLNPEDQRAACQRLVKDQKVFAVVAHSVFEAGSECVARNEKTPVIMPDPMPAATVQAGAPFYFSLSMSVDTMGRNLVHFAKSRKLLDGKKIGMYYADDNGPVSVLAREVKATLGKLGYTLEAEQSTPQASSAQAANPQPGPDDQLAVQRFQQAGVQMAFLFGTQGRFMQAAQQQRYKAQYINTDQSVGASDTTVSAYPPDQFDGAYAFTGTRRQEAKLGRLSPKAQQCLDDYIAGTGDRLDPIKRESEWGSLSILCDVMNTALEGLKQAGPNLTHPSFVQGMERIRGLQLAMQGVTSFGPNRHAGGDGYRSLLWRKGTGYQIQAPTDFQPLWVP